MRRKKNTFFLQNIIDFTAVKYRCILHGHVFIMTLACKFYDDTPMNILQFFTAVKTIIL